MSVGTWCMLGNTISQRFRAAERLDYDSCASHYTTRSVSLGGGHLGCGRQRRAAQPSGVQARCHAFLWRAEAVASGVIITGIVFMCGKDASVMFDLRSNNSYVSSYFSSCLDMPLDSLDVHNHVSTPVRDSIMVYRVYRYYCHAPSPRSAIGAQPSEPG